MSPLARERAVAIEAARRAADAVMEVYRTSFDVAWKGPIAGEDPVTAADRAANEIIVRALNAAFPDDVVVAEESAVPDGFGAHRRCWFVDPLDGTKELVARNGEFCVMIGLAIDGRAALGVVVVPALPLNETTGFTVVGELGVGAVVIDGSGSERALVVPSDVPAEPRVLVSRSHRHPRLAEILARLGTTREVVCGSVGVKIARLLLGDADAYVHPASGRGSPKLWDLCAPDAITTAAGGVFTDEHGARINYAAAGVAHEAGIVVSGRALHAQIVRAAGH